MRNLLFITCVLLLLGCKNLLVNAGLGAMGVYDDHAKMHITESATKTVVLLPTHHLGTPLYYEDLHKKIDSLSALNYFFYTESINTTHSEDTLLRKFRKFSGSPIAVNGYKYLFDSIIGKNNNLKLKKKIIDQPSYAELGVPTEQSENVDATLEELIGYYESKYGEIKLAPCDFETELTEKSTCQKLKISRVIKDEVIEDFRNGIVLKRVDVETHDKIVIIYGDAHTPGILKGLKERGFR